MDSLLQCSPGRVFVRIKVWVSIVMVFVVCYYAKFAYMLNVYSLISVLSSISWSKYQHTTRRNPGLLYLMKKGSIIIKMHHI